MDAQQVALVETS